MPILRLAGTAPRRRRPVNSALGGEEYMPWLACSAGAAFHMASAASRGLRPQAPSFAIIHAQFRPRQVQHEQAASANCVAPSALTQAASTVHPTAWRQLHGHHSSQQKRHTASAPPCLARACRGQFALSAQRRAPCQLKFPHFGTCGTGVALVHGLRQPWAPSSRTSPPNPSLNRSANGMAPCPRGSACLSSASRARRHAVVARLTLR